MTKIKYKAIISDIDGTLTPLVPDALPSESVVKYIKEATSKGLIFSLASGRPYFMVKYLIEHLGYVGPCITDNGAVIVDSRDGSILWEAILPHNRVDRILELTQQFKLFRASCDTGGVENPKHLPLTSKVRKISVHDIPEIKANKIIDKICSEFKDVVGVKAASYEGDHLVDVYFSDIKATKQFAVNKLAEILKISTDEIIGVGDGHNDISLLKACGLKIAMGNAVSELKNIADYVAPSVEMDGLVNVIKKFIL